jgi:hypothetical protein
MITAEKESNMPIWIIISAGCHQESSVSIAIAYGSDGHGSIPSMSKRFFSSPQHPDRIWGSPSLSSGYEELLPQR